ncbi:hypothetical protein [Aestuariibacter salexigens]|uniref:hypothetical protein n=1 Tax=Aestuariibacter salexigens TaxID=226010 RepID=UPI00042217BC|nr:hypothetical protein [Aestuariibacter salexigens]
MKKLEYRRNKKIRTSRLVRMVVLLLIAAYLVYHEMTLAFAQAQELTSATQDNRQRLQCGQILYNYFQQDALATLQQIAVAEQQGVALENTQHISLIKGAASIHAGMPGQAAQIFSQVKDSLHDPELVAKATYWTAYLAFSQQHYALSSQIAASADWPLMQTYLSPDQRQQWLYQQSFVMQMNNNPDWHTAFSLLPEQSRFRSYLQFNQAAQLLTQSQWQEGLQALTRAQSSLSTSEQGGWFDWFADARETSRVDIETQALLDRIQLLRGQVFAAQGLVSEALTAFTSVRQESMESEQALLSYGWTLANHQRLDDAMSVWQYLSRRYESVYAIQASHALAWGFEQRGAQRQAFAQLEVTVSTLEQALLAASGLALSIDNEGYYEQLAAALSLQNDNQLQTLWPAQHRDVLSGLLAGEVGDQLEQMSRLQQQTHLLNEYKKRAEAMQQLLSERSIERRRRLDAIDAEQPAAKLTNLQKQVASLSQGIVTAERQFDGAHFASADEKAQLERLTRAERIIERLDEHNKQAYSDRFNRIQGVLAWQLQERFSDRLWQAKKGVASLHQHINKAQKQLARIEDIRKKGDDIQQQKQRLLALNHALSKVTDQQITLASRLTDAIQVQVSQALAARHTQLNEQLLQTRLSMLRMQDSALLAHSGGQP